MVRIQVRDDLESAVKGYNLALDVFLQNTGDIVSTKDSDSMNHHTYAMSRMPTSW